MRYALVVGDANVDLVIHMPGAPHPAAGDLHPHIVGGGTAANTAVALARLGLPVRFAGSVGADRYGRWIADDLRREGVDAGALVALPDAFTPTVIIVVAADGERQAVLWPPDGWAHTQLRPEHLPAELLAGAGWLHVTGMCLRAEPVRSATLHAMRQARAAGAAVSFDLNLRLELWGWGDGIRESAEQAIALADVVLGSAEEEIAPMAGCDDPERAARALGEGRRTVVARLGAAGCLAVAPGEVARAAALPVTVVNTVGAGDAFNGGFIAARMRGRPLGEALRWGSAVAAYKIQGDSARDLPGPGDLARLLG